MFGISFLMQLRSTLIPVPPTFDSRESTARGFLQLLTYFELSMFVQRNLDRNVEFVSMVLTDEVKWYKKLWIEGCDNRDNDMQMLIYKWKLNSFVYCVEREWSSKTYLIVFSGITAFDITTKCGSDFVSRLLSIKSGSWKSCWGVQKTWKWKTTDLLRKGLFRKDVFFVVKFLEKRQNFMDFFFNVAPF